MWWARHPDRFSQELKDIGDLQEQAEWLVATTPKQSGLGLVCDFDLSVNGEVRPFTLQYHDSFPDTPPEVVPRDGRRVSGHQYGVGGELCLEHRADNWEPSITGAMMIESAYRLLQGEAPKLNERAQVASAHRTSAGQELRGTTLRFLATKDLKEYCGTLEIGEFRDLAVFEEYRVNSVWVAYPISAGPDETPVWKEPELPGTRNTLPALLVRLASLTTIPDSITPELLEEYLSGVPRGDDSLVWKGEEAYFVLLTDGISIRMIFSCIKDGKRLVLPYRMVDLSTDIGTRLPAEYQGLKEKNVGIVGCGSLGSKVAVALARSGVREFVLIDDDFMKPGNLVRHDLDFSTVGLHKAQALAQRLHAVAMDVRVASRRISLGGQEAASDVASALEKLSGCDLIIDATANDRAFNFVASIARNSRKPMVWSEIYAGGIGGFVARVRPDIEPIPQLARRQYHEWCKSKNVPWAGRDHNYESELGEGDTPLMADDCDVSIIAAHTAKIALDTLARPASSLFPHPGYVLGFSSQWVFSEPFETHPIDFVSEGGWGEPVSAEKRLEAIDTFINLAKEKPDEG